MKESIDSFLIAHKDVAEEIKILAKNYSVSDFIQVTTTCKDYFKGGKRPENRTISGCIYDIRGDNFRLDIESAESRMTCEYLDFVVDAFRDNEIENKVFYIVAYHYLALGKHLGYNLTGRNGAPFTVFEDGAVSPRGKRHLEELQKICEGELYSLVKYLSEADILYYNTFYSSYGYHHHATKHFSLLADLDVFNLMVRKHEFKCQVRYAIDLFVFRHKAIFTTDRLRSYTSGDDIEKIRKNLVNIYDD